MRTHLTQLMKWSFVGAFIVCGTLTSARAQLFVEVGNHGLFPATSGQTVDIFITNLGGTEVLVSGLDFSVQVADSGPSSEGGFGIIDGPDITGVDILSGSIFASNNTGANDGGSVPQFANRTTTTSSGTVSFGAGTTTKLATLTISTVGFSTPQTWDLNLLDTINGSTLFLDSIGGNIFPTINDGTLSVVPEPVSTALGGALLVGFALWWRARGKGAGL